MPPVAREDGHHGRAKGGDAIAIHPVTGGKIPETWEVWDALGFLQQIGAVPPN